MGSLLTELHQKNIWAIARIVAFKDASQINAHPEWYLKHASAKAIPNAGCARKKYLRVPAPAGVTPSIPLWQDNKGGYWMDPASPGARQYILALAKKMADLGFDEVQFDYVRFPSDGDVAKAMYPAWDGKTPKYVVMKSFFEFLHDNLKAYKPELILSADLFGYVATSGSDVGIGQRLEDVGDNFDFVSLMVYPSHYYSGLVLPPDPVRKLPAINWNVNQARTNPGILVERAMFFAEDLLNKRTASSSVAVAASSTVPAVGVSSTTPRHARLRPWLEDFFHEADRVAGRPSGELKVRLQADAAEKSSGHGWLLWNASNVYTESALKAE
ncbi:MAG: putative glycoside hydrolase [Candidatus Sungbacteria bacterium]|nr:putative glycoside hydrolase [Candidatus Sungbacteria bacterium]